MCWWTAAALLWVRSEVTLVKKEGRRGGRCVHRSLLHECVRDTDGHIYSCRWSIHTLFKYTCVGCIYTLWTNACMHITFFLQYTHSCHLCLYLKSDSPPPLGVSHVFFMDYDTHHDQTSCLRILIHLSVFLQREADGDKAGKIWLQERGQNKWAVTGQGHISIFILKKRKRQIITHTVEVTEILPFFWRTRKSSNIQLMMLWDEQNKILLFSGFAGLG